MKKTVGALFVWSLLTGFDQPQPNLLSPDEVAEYGLIAVGSTKTLEQLPVDAYAQGYGRWNVSGSEHNNSDAYMQKYGGVNLPGQAYDNRNAYMYMQTYDRRDVSNPRPDISALIGQGYSSYVNTCSASLWNILGSVACQANPVPSSPYSGAYVSGDAGAFYYIRQDHFFRLQSSPEGAAAISSYQAFGPHPLRATVRVRRGANYVFFPVCGSVVAIAKGQLLKAPDDGQTVQVAVTCRA